MTEGLELTPSEREQLARTVSDWALKYFREQSDLPVYPTESAKDLSSLLAGPLPVDPQDLAKVMSDFQHVADHGSCRGDSGR